MTTKSLDNFFMEKTRITPEISFNIKSDEGVLSLYGGSVPGDSWDFYSPLINYIEDYCKKPRGKTTLNFNLDYFNNGSCKVFLDLFKKFESVHKINKGVKVNWYYGEGDDEMLESGEDFKSVIRIPFRMIEKID